MKQFLIVATVVAALGAQTTPAQPSRTGVTYKMPADGQLTLGLFDKDGKLLRWLAQDDFRYVGENRESMAEGRLPRLFLDDVEFVDVTP